MEQPGYFPVKKAAAWAGVSPKTLQRWIGRGLPVYQAGPREKMLVRPLDIEHFLIRKQEPPHNLDDVVDAVLKDLLKPSEN